MKLVNGPYDGKIAEDGDYVPGDELVFQGRSKIDSNFYDVDHLYEFQEDSTAVYRFSQFEWRVGIK